MNYRRTVTDEQALIKLTALCAKGEHCKEEMRTKMQRWGIEPERQEKILDYLVKERYIDEERYARFFINDKIKYNKWGCKKVEQALYMKRIPREIYEPILSAIEDESYEEILLPLLKNKVKTVKASSDYEKRGKLIRFALQRGFSMDQALHCLELLKVGSKNSHELNYSII